MIHAHLLSAAALGLMALSDDVRRRHAEILRLTTARAGMTLQRAAQEAEKDPGQFNRQIDGREGSLPTLWAMPASWWQWYAVTILEAFGLPEAMRVAAQFERVVDAPKPQAQMGLADLWTEERIA